MGGVGVVGTGSVCGGNGDSLVLVVVLTGVGCDGVGDSVAVGGIG